MTLPITPLLTVDIIIELVEHPGKILLIERKFPPHGWAIPGGFVDVGECLEAAAIREAKEATNLDIELKCLLGNYSDPARDDRGHTVSAVYIANASGQPTAMDDAKNFGMFAEDELPVLAFDHAKIINDYYYFKETNRLRSLSF